MKLPIVYAAVVALGTLPTGAQTPSDQWGLTDALGRTSRSYTEAGEKNEGRFVGMFYWTWHQTHDDTTGAKENKSMKVKNIREVLEANPEAINQYNHPAWGVGGERPSTFYWDEPIFGYYRSDDTWVLRKHAEMLADAGVDVVFFDCTNGSLLWETSTEALMKTWSQALKDGVNVPKISFLLPFSATADSKRSLQRLYEWIYSKERYKELWFYWKDKPLIMGYPDNLATDGVEGQIRNFFTFRPGQPDYVAGPRSLTQWGWLEVYPTHGFAIDFMTGKNEQCTVGIAQNARAASGGHCCAFTLPYTYGRSYSQTQGFDQRPDGYLYGWNFQEQWDRAIDVLKPDFVFVTGWNEWTSGMWNSSHGWSDPLSFVDQYDADHSRDIEPTRGWGDKGDVYYQQLVDNVRRFKGMEAPEESTPGKSITLGNLSEWDDVLPKYTAYRGNTFHRDNDGRYDRHYTDTSGRNDIVGAQATHDEANVYFRVETADPLTPSSDPNWMTLYIDADADPSTGWNGYDYIVNRVSPVNGKVSVERHAGDGWKWMASGQGLFKVTGNVLEISVPKILLGMGANPDFDFKWADNLQHPGDPLDFYVSGDVAPGGRFNYVYRAYDDGTGAVEEVAKTVKELKVYAAGSNAIRIECEGEFTVCNMMGVTVARGTGDRLVSLPGPGQYIVVSNGQAVKTITK